MGALNNYIAKMEKLEKNGGSGQGSMDSQGGALDKYLSKMDGSPAAAQANGINQTEKRHSYFQPQTTDMYSGKSYLRDTMENRPSAKAPDFQTQMQREPERWNAQKTRQQQIEELFDKYFDEADEEDDLYKSLGPQHAGETISPELDKAFDAGWYEDDSLKAINVPMKYGRGTVPANKEENRRKIQAGAVQQFQTLNGEEKRGGDFRADRLTNMNQTDKLLNVKDEQEQGIVEGIIDFFTGNSLRNGTENDTINDAESLHEYYQQVVDNIPDIVALGAGGTPETKLYQKAREKYNSSNINIYWEGEGEPKEGMINVRFYNSHDDNTGMDYVNIHIDNSLSVKNEYEMSVILDEIMKSKYYSEEMFGTKKHMMAQWVAHNLCYDLYNSPYLPESFGKALGNILGASDPKRSSEELDLRQIGNTLFRNDIIYAILEVFAT